MPLHEKIGVPIVGTWVHRPQNEVFIFDVSSVMTRLMVE
jgi:hypothetical protein